MSVWVQLNDEEWLRARYCGMQRQHKPGSRHRFAACGKGYDKQFGDHIMAAAAELAVAKLIGTEWTGHYDQPKSVPDIAPDIEVRWRGYTEAKFQELIIRKDDFPDRFYVLTCHGRQEKGFEIVGGVWGRDAARKGQWANPGYHHWAWFIPKDKVEPIEDNFLVKFRGV